LKKSVKYISISLIAVVITALIIIPKLFSKKEGDSKNKMQGSNQQGQVVISEGLIIKPQLLDNEIKTIGTIRANEEVELRSEVARKIKGIYFREGTYVSKGKTLFKLDSDDLVAKLRKQELDEQLAIVKLEREKQLLEKGLTPQEDFDVAENNLDKIRADMTSTRIDIQKTYIKAPFSGIIGLRNVSVGSFVNSSVPLATIQDVSKVKIDFSIPEKYFSLFKAGQKIVFSVEGIPGEFEAEVYAYEPKIENNTRTLVLRAIASNPNRKLMPGNFANVTLKLSENKDAMMVPSQIIVPKLKGQSLFVYKNGEANLVDVEIGTRTENMVQVTSGINAGDTILTANILRLKQGAKVKLERVE
jgi:membrane fusion protein (multidrug efflux system)